MNKKVVLLALAMVLAFTACGRKADIKETDSVLESDEEITGPEEERAEDPGAGDVQEPEQASVPEAETGEAEGTEPAFSKGTVYEDGWESEWAGMRFTAPEGMKMTTEEELDALMGVSADLLSEDLGEAELKYAELTSVKEMMCVDEGTNANVIVSVDLLPGKITEELFAQALEETLSNISAMEYESTGSNEWVEIAGLNFLKSGYYVEAVGKKMYMDYYMRSTGLGYRAVSIVVTYGEGCEEQVRAMLEGFQSYE